MSVDAMAVDIKSVEKSSGHGAVALQPRALLVFTACA